MNEIKMVFQFIVLPLENVIKLLKPSKHLKNEVSSCRSLLANYKQIQKLMRIFPPLLNKNLKPGPQLPKKLFYLLRRISPLKLMKNAFYFILKTLLIFMIFKFLTCIIGYVEKTA